MASRPLMQARDSSGRQVSLLNEEPSLPKSILYAASQSIYDAAPEMVRSNSYVSDSSSQSTPDLLRSNSYDSGTANDSSSPLTPSLPDFGRRDSYNLFAEAPSFDQRREPHLMYDSYPSKRHSSSASMHPSYSEYQSGSYEDSPRDRRTPEHSGPGAASSAKRYPCRYKDSHGCDKTFTTSGHASRHSKIHTAEKAVGCSFAGCVKKFTRADNMKQHLETHFKERSRSTASHKSSHTASSSSSSSSAPLPSPMNGATTKLTIPAGVQKKPRSSRPASRTDRPEQSRVEKSPSRSYLPCQPRSADRYAENAAPYLRSPTSPIATNYGGPLDMGGFRRSLPLQSKTSQSRSLESRIGVARRKEHSSGLDVLCVAVSQMR